MMTSTVTSSQSVSTVAMSSAPLATDAPTNMQAMETRIGRSEEQDIFVLDLHCLPLLLVQLCASKKKPTTRWRKVLI
jgi:hypothetical protein